MKVFVDVVLFVWNRGNILLYNWNASSKVFYQLANNFLVKHMLCFFLLKLTIWDAFYTDVLLFVFWLQVSWFEEKCIFGRNLTWFVILCTNNIHWNSHIVAKKISNLSLEYLMCNDKYEQGKNSVSLKLRYYEWLVIFEWLIGSIGFKLRPQSI